ncbi:MAG: superoxide dismutase [Rhodospirillaceae bacterium]|nr:superoxide dismutase [Rhodospirillaceae bacterium]|tara:strand:- start:482 stop:769 length:288 start_codon:yes stop_codon:yes gene_type:complete
MKVIAIATRSPDHTAEQFAPHLQEESQRAMNLFAKEIFREIYSRRDGKGAVIVLEAESEEQAREAVDSLPLVKLGMLSVEIYPVQPYRAFAALAQ